MANGVNDQLLDSWALSLRARNRSPATIDAYLADAHRLLDVVDVPLHAMQRADLERAIAGWLASDLAPATVARRYRSLQQFFRWADEEGELDNGNPMARMSPPTLPDTLPKFPTDDEVRRLLAACRNPDKASNSRHGRFERDRDAAIVLVLTYTGVRVAELVGMRRDDVMINHADPAVRVLGKGRRERVVALPAQAATAVDRYLRARRHHRDAESGWLWLSERGRLTESGVRQLLRRRCADAGIDPAINPHAFRHRFAHIAKSRGMSDEDVMSLAGWATPQMLARYGRSASSERARAAAQRVFGEDDLR